MKNLRQLSLDKRELVTLLDTVIAKIDPIVKKYRGSPEISEAEYVQDIQVVSQADDELQAKLVKFVEDCNQFKKASKDAKELEIIAENIDLADSVFESVRASRNTTMQRIDEIRAMRV